MDKDDDGNTRWLPSGHVTFVFTDIEGSTRLYKALGQDIATQVFDKHNELMRTAWDKYGGHEVHTEGDSFFVVFEDPNAAVAACIDVQEQLAAHHWPPNGDVRVRIGIHSGLAAPRHNDYMALSVHQAARVSSAANGDQILITDSIANELKLSQLTESGDVSLVRTGVFRLRDFDQAPVLHRVETPTGRSNDQPPRATPAAHHNLVPRLNSFVGRNRDVVAVTGMLQSGCAVTLVGLGGMGKTRLATEVGLNVADKWEHGVWMVEVADVVDPELIAEEVATSIGVDTGSIGERWNDVLEFIGDKSMLLILDNVEHLIDECARLAPELLRTCPNLAILATSREPLNCQGEVVYRVQPLDLAVEAAPPAELPSVRLFMDRARAVAPDSVWSDDMLATVVEICEHLDGLPLAIEIAAAQVGVLQLTEILGGLSNRFRLLRSRDRALPDRQRTMEGLLGWSYQLLTESEQRAFRRLAVFAGSFSIDAAEAALSGHGIEADDVPELIWALVDKSLIAVDLSVSATRYRLLESVQQYAMRLLIDNDDPVRVASSLGDWLLGSVAPWLPNDRRWLGDVAMELANIRTVVDLVADVVPETAQQLMCSVGRYHDTVQSFDTGIDELRRAASELPARTPSRVSLLACLADLHLRRADVAQAAILLDEAKDLAAAVGPPSWDDVATERTAGELAARSGNHELAVSIAESTLKRDLSPRGVGRMWNLLGIARHAQGLPAQARDAFQKELDVYVALDHQPGIASAHGNIAETAMMMSDLRGAARHQRDCLTTALALGQPLMTAYSLLVASRLAAEDSQWALAVRLQAAADEMISSTNHALYEADRRVSDETMRRATQALGEDQFETASREAASVSTIKAVELAVATFDYMMGLTPSQQHPTVE